MIFLLLLCIATCPLLGPSYVLPRFLVSRRARHAPAMGKLTPPRPPAPAPGNDPVDEPQTASDLVVDDEGGLTFVRGKQGP